mmetsp:Transcript_19817/g.59015  ORF Transcript_19817/g.59015 Transcript_19817/m.59015 type:complete len:319 (-) Transcript_19817:330-1286(-)
MPMSASLLSARACRRCQQACPAASTAVRSSARRACPPQSPPPSRTNRHSQEHLYTQGGRAAGGREGDSRLGTCRGSFARSRVCVRVCMCVRVHACCVCMCVRRLCSVRPYHAAPLQRALKVRRRPVCERAVRRVHREIAGRVHLVVVDSARSEVGDDLLHRRLHLHLIRLIEGEQSLDVAEREEASLGHVLPVEVHAVLEGEPRHEEALQVQLELRRREVRAHHHVRPQRLAVRARPLGARRPAQKLVPKGRRGEELFAGAGPGGLLERAHQQQPLPRPPEQEPPIGDVRRGGHRVEVARRQSEQVVEHEQLRALPAY